MKIIECTGCGGTLKESGMETIDFEKANTQDDILKQQVDKIKGIFKK